VELNPFPWLRRRKNRKRRKNDPLKYKVWGLTISPGWLTKNVNHTGAVCDQELPNSLCPMGRIHRRTCGCKRSLLKVREVIIHSQLQVELLVLHFPPFSLQHFTKKRKNVRKRKYKREYGVAQMESGGQESVSLFQVLLKLMLTQGKDTTR
jgi:hypothetical protein